jgi:hypothetical protein
MKNTGNYTTLASEDIVIKLFSLNREQLNKLIGRASFSTSFPGSTSTVDDDQTENIQHVANKLGFNDIPEILATIQDVIREYVESAYNDGKEEGLIVMAKEWGRYRD